MRLSVAAEVCTDAALLLPAAAVELGRVQRENVDTIQASGIDRDHRGAVGPGTAGKGFDPADLAEEMVDDVFVELEVRQALLTGEQREILCRREGQNASQPPAARAVASDGVIEIGGDLVAN